jgi:Na+/melibiose symporter-like transporter
MHTDQPARAPHLSTPTLIAYGLPSWPMGAMGIGVFVYLPTVYAEVTTISMATLGLVFLLVRFMDVVSDPMIGWLSDRTGSRFGRRRPWVAVSWIPMAGALVALCQPAPDASVAYLFGWSVVFFVSGTALFMPYTAWGAELSGDYHERSRVFAWRHVFAVVGALSAAGALAVYDPTLGAPREAQAVETLTNASILLLPATLLILLLKVPDPLPAASARAAAGWRHGLILIRANRGFRILLGGYFLNGLANATLGTLFFLYVDHVLMVDVKVTSLLLYFGLAILGTPIWVRLSRAWGKHRAWGLAMAIGAGAFVLALTVGKGDQLLFYLSVAILGVTLGADLTLPGAMQADAVDQERAETGLQRTGVYFAMWAMVAKLALAFAVGISFPILGLFGFDPVGVNEGRSLTAMVILFAAFPATLKISAAALILRYPLTAARHADLQAQIAARSMRSE